jgi:serine/threonine protein kinase
VSNDHELWLQADQLFERALDLEPPDRTALLDRECRDPAVRRLVEALLEAEAHADSPLDRTPVYDPSTERQPHLSPPRDSGEIDLRGRRLGAFEIVGEIGRGGMAVVYRARRVDGEVEQDVAIKVLARSLASADSRARFRRERQILANSDHPGVARLIDGGETAEGLLYLVMELVDGQRIDEYCDARRASIRERIELFREVGRTVADAHRRLVVHRDIKPSNILVSATGFPRLLDFGIAKLLEDPESATRTGWLLTPAYAAPEQFSGGEITTATDVYQLGLLLYNLLVGAAPYPVDGAPAEIIRHVCRTPPERPALAAARHATLDDEGLTGPQLAARRISSRRQLKAQLSGDLEAILLKALRKEPELRYRSVEALLDDLERYLEGRPVRARRTSMAYRLRKLAERHRGAFATGLPPAVPGRPNDLPTNATAPTVRRRPPGKPRSFWPDSSSAPIRCAAPAPV